MLFNLPIALGALLTLLAVCFVVFTNGYRRIEKWIIAFVSLIGLSFLFELSLVHVAWFDAYKAWFVPAIPPQSLPLIMSVLGAVVMPHNIFLHSEIIQSRQWNLRSEEVIRQQLKYEYADTLIAMIIGWAINSAMIIISAAVFFKNGVQVSELSQGQALLVPFLGKTAALVFAFALLLSGFSSSVTAAIASGSIFAGIYREPLDLQDSHSRVGALIALIGAFGIILLLRGTFDALIWSQVALSIQLPFTVFGLIRLTSSRSVMGKYVNSRIERTVLLLIAVVVTVLNLALLIQTLVGPGSAG